MYSTIIEWTWRTVCPSRFDANALFFVQGQFKRRSTAPELSEALSELAEEVLLKLPFLNEALNKVSL